MFHEKPAFHGQYAKCSAERGLPRAHVIVLLTALSWSVFAVVMQLALLSFT